MAEICKGCGTDCVYRHRMFATDKGDLCFVCAAKVMVVHECHIHKSFGLGKCSGCLGFDLYEVSLAWRDARNRYMERRVQLDAPSAMVALEEVVGEVQETFVGIGVRLLRTAQEREMEVKWANWEESKGEPATPEKE